MGTITPGEMFRRAEECLSQAYALLGDAQDWLRSDWPPGTVLSDAQAARRAALRRACAAAKDAINEGRSG